MTNRKGSETMRAALRRVWRLWMLALPLVLTARNTGTAPGY